jgi:hypothetical protein
VYISIVDQDANLNPRSNDQFTVDPDSGPNNDLLELDGGTFEDVVLFRETGDNTGVFEGKYRLGVSIIADVESLVLTLHEKANYNATLASPANDSNGIDELGFTIGNSDGMVDIGGQTSVPTVDPAIKTDGVSYVPGDTVHVTIADRDANAGAGVVDSIHLKISSGSSAIEVLALETGVNTGIFEASFTLSENAEQGAIEPGGSALVTYTDERPADYYEKLQAGEDPEKDFTLEIDIRLPVKTGTDSTNLTAPVATDVAGGTGPLAVGESITLSTSISNSNEHEQPFVVIIEVRDSEGVTVYLALQGGMLEPTGSADIGVLWQPGQPGTYEVRTFAISHVGAEAGLLSTPAVSEIIVT